MLKVDGKTLVKKVRYANTPWQRTKGLMFEDKKKYDYALIFNNGRETKLGSSIHMIFVFFPIDVLFLDKEKRVIDNVKLMPFNPNYTPKKPAQYIIELPEGKGTRVKVGAKVSWEEKKKGKR